MARTPVETNNQDFTVTDADTPGLATMRDAVNYLDAAQVEISENAKAVALQIGYDGPLTLGGLEDGIRFYQRRTAEGCMEIGKRMLVMREIAPRGEFLERLKLHGFSKSTAYRFMQAARKFSKLPKLGSLAATPESAGKFLELLILDDDEIEQLDKEGSVRGITFDAIDLMCASELKKALRDANDKLQAKEDVIEKKSAFIDKQAEKLALLENKKRNISPDQALAEARANLQATGLDIKAHVMTSLRKALLELYEHPGNHALYAAGLLAEIGRELNVLRDEYNLPSQISDAIITDPTWAAIEAGQAG